MSKTLEGMEKRMTNIERNMATMETKIMTNVKTNMTNVETTVKGMEINITAKVEENLTKMEAKTEAKIESVNNVVRELKETLTVKMEDMKEEIIREGRATASGGKEKENIIVAGGYWADSVEMFKWRQKLWSPLQSMPKKLQGATSFVYNNHLTVAGGWCSGYVDEMIRMNIEPSPDLSVRWSECPVKLPAKLQHHSSVLYNDQLLVTGGYNGNLRATSDRIDEVQLVPPYAVKTLSRMPEPRQEHSTEIFDNNLLIVGGRTTGKTEDNLKSVVLYDVKKNECKQLAPLPYEVSEMATVRWGENIVVIGGADKHGKALDTVIIYNVKTEQSHMLPPMRCKREGCAAVVIGNKIVVLGGWSEQRKIKSVEAFNFDSYTWEELPEMSQERWLHTAVAACCCVNNV